MAAVIFDLQLRERNGWAVVAIVGELDLATAPQVRQAVVRAIADAAHQAPDRPAHVVLDLAGVDFVDSVGLGVVLGALKRVRAVGGDLRIVVGEEQVREVFELTGLDQLLTIEPSIERAIGGPGAVIGSPGGTTTDG